MKNTYLITFLGIALLFFSCNSKREMDEKTVLSDLPIKTSLNFTPPVITDEPKEGDESNSAAAPATNTVVDKKKIIRDGSISIRTKDMASCKKGVDALVKSLGGYIDNEYLQNDDDRISYDLKVRISAANFDKMLEALENGKDDVRSKNIEARDVTEEFVDIETRLANKQVYLKRYKELLAKASTVRDILAIEEQIRVIQEEIESREGRLKFLNDQVAFSTLDINLYKVKEFVYKQEPQDKFSERVKMAFNKGWQTLVQFVLWIFSLWSFVLLIIVIVFAVKWRRKSVKKSKAGKK